MRIKSKLLSVAFVSAALPFISVTSAQASEMCTVRTAKQSVSSNTLCACDVVSSRMVRYIQRRADFENILERTLIDCPAFASVLTDLPTASIGFADQRSGDGKADEQERDPSGPTSSGPSPDSDPDPSTPDGEKKEREKRTPEERKKIKEKRAELRSKREAAQFWRENSKTRAEEAKLAREIGDLGLAQLKRDQARLSREIAREFRDAARSLREELEQYRSNAQYQPAAKELQKLGAFETKEVRGFEKRDEDDIGR